MLGCDLMAADLRLLCENARQYNEEDSKYYEVANKLEKKGLGYIEVVRRHLAAAAEEDAEEEASRAAAMRKEAEEEAERAAMLRAARMAGSSTSKAVAAIQPRGSPRSDSASGPRQSPTFEGDDEPMFAPGHSKAGSGPLDSFITHRSDWKVTVPRNEPASRRLVDQPITGFVVPKAGDVDTNPAAVATTADAGAMYSRRQIAAEGAVKAAELWHEANAYFMPMDEADARKRLATIRCQPEVGCGVLGGSDSKADAMSSSGTHSEKDDLGGTTPRSSAPQSPRRSPRRSPSTAAAGGAAADGERSVEDGSDSSGATSGAPLSAHDIPAELRALADSDSRIPPLGTHYRVAASLKDMDIAAMEEALRFRGWRDEDFTELRREENADISEGSSLGMALRSAQRASLHHSLSVRFGDDSDADVIHKLNRVNRSFTSADDFQASMRTKNEHVLLAEKNGKVCAFVHYYFNWYADRGDDERPNVRKRLAPARVMYVATLQAAKQGTHGDLVASGQPLAPPNTGSVLLALAMQHACLSGMVAVLIDATKSAVPFYQKKFGFTSNKARKGHNFFPMVRELANFDFVSAVVPPSADDSDIGCAAERDEVVDALLRAQAELEQVTRECDFAIEEVMRPVAEAAAREATPEAVALRRETARLVADFEKKAAARAEELQWQAERAEADLEAVCAICDDEESPPRNPIVFCDRCNLATHQRCYGITELPDGDWFCDACAAGESPNNLQCAVCPRTGGAYKRVAMTSGVHSFGGAKWAHVVCGMAIPQLWLRGTGTCVGGIDGFDAIGGVQELQRHLSGWTARPNCTVCKMDIGLTIPCSHAKVSSVAATAAPAAAAGDETVVSSVSAADDAAMPADSAVNASASRIRCNAQVHVTCALTSSRMVRRLKKPSADVSTDPFSRQQPYAPSDEIAVQLPITIEAWCAQHSPGADNEFDGELAVAAAKRAKLKKHKYIRCHACRWKVRARDTVMCSGLDGAVSGEGGTLKPSCRKHYCFECLMLHDISIDQAKAEEGANSFRCPHCRSSCQCNSLRRMTSGTTGALLRKAEERERRRQGKATGLTRDLAPPPVPDIFICGFCRQGESSALPENLLIICEDCGVAVHQVCYGVTTAPEGRIELPELPSKPAAASPPPVKYSELMLGTVLADGAAGKAGDGALPLTGSADGEVGLTKEAEHATNEGGNGELPASSMKDEITQRLRTVAAGRLRNMRRGWQCEPCSEGLDTANLPCALCPNRGGAYKPAAAGTKLRGRAKSNKGRGKRKAGKFSVAPMADRPDGELAVSPDATWVHCECACWVPETGFGDAFKMSPVVGLNDVDPRRTEMRCVLCKLSGGAVVQCSWRTCGSPFHVSCAYIGGLDLHWEEDPSPTTDQVHAVCMCPRHHGRSMFPPKEDTLQNSPLRRLVGAPAPPPPPTAPQEVFCVCRRPDVGEFMVGCEGGCDDWFHPACVGYALCKTHEASTCLIEVATSRHLILSSEPFVCPGCSGKPSVETPPSATTPAPDEKSGGSAAHGDSQARGAGAGAGGAADGGGVSDAGANGELPAGGGGSAANHEHPRDDSAPASLDLQGAEEEPAAKRARAEAATPGGEAATPVALMAAAGFDVEAGDMQSPSPTIPNGDAGTSVAVSVMSRSPTADSSASNSPGGSVRSSASGRPKRSRTVRADVRSFIDSERSKIEHAPSTRECPSDCYAVDASQLPPATAVASTPVAADAPRSTPVAPTARAVAAAPKAAKRQLTIMEQLSVHGS